MSFDLLPYLRPDSSSKGLYNIDLCFLDEVQQVPPKITFITNKRERVQDLEALGITGSELVKKSFENLYKIEISVDDASANEAGVLIFDQEYSSEKILDKKFINNAAASLEAEKIWIAIPVRNSILICNASDQEAAASLELEAQQLYHNFAKEALSTLIFLVEDGIIQSAKTPKTSMAGMQDIKPSFGTFNANVIKTKLFEELFNVRIIVEAEQMADLQNGMFYTILEVINEHRGDINFNNSIEITSGSASMDKSREHVLKIRELFDKVAEKYSLTYTDQVEPIKLSFLFNEDFGSGDMHKKIIKHLK